MDSKVDHERLRQLAEGTRILADEGSQLIKADGSNIPIDMRRELDRIATQEYFKRRIFARSNTKPLSTPPTESPLRAHPTITDNDSSNIVAVAIIITNDDGSLSCLYSHNVQASSITYEVVPDDVDATETKVDVKFSLAKVGASRVTQFMDDYRGAEGVFTSKASFVFVKNTVERKGVIVERARKSARKATKGK